MVANNVTIFHKYLNKPNNDTLTYLFYMCSTLLNSHFNAIFDIFLANYSMCALRIRRHKSREK